MQNITNEQSKAAVNHGLSKLNLKILNQLFPQLKSSLSVIGEIRHFNLMKDQICVCKYRLMNHMIHMHFRKMGNILIKHALFRCVYKYYITMNHVDFRKNITSI